jgi:hypothetical protein
MPNTKKIGWTMVTVGVLGLIYLVSISQLFVAYDNAETLKMKLGTTFGGYLILCSILSIGIGGMKLKGKGSEVLDMIFIILIGLVLVPMILGPLFR